MCFFPLLILLFSLPHIIFSLPSPTFLYTPSAIFLDPILPRLERVLYSAVTNTL